ncbi:hypothetical protein [Acidocella sp.]|jgi:hypothetical protein|uniref:hypothetical protein n=1 Tax=Acidocella sp. TaxID=50710 RepID=UPI002F422A32
MRNFGFLAASVLFFAWALPATADEQVTPLAVSGDWMAAAHSDSITDPPDVCMAMEPSAKFFIRVDNTDIEFRLANDSWSLPAGVTGTLEVDVNGKKYPLDITSNTSTMVSATVGQDVFLKIVGDMNKASSMSVIAGSAAPVQVPLDGSNTVMNAFLTCANIHAPSQGGGTNPFQSSAASGD